MTEIKTIKKIDLTKVSASRSAAQAGNYVKVYAPSFLSENVTYEDNGDGTITVKNGGIAIGVITEDAILESTTDPDTGATLAGNDTRSMIDDAKMEEESKVTEEEVKSDVPDITVQNVEEIKEEPVVSPEPEKAPVENKTTPITVIDSNVDLSKYSGNLHTKGKASEGIKASSGTITSGNQGYTIVPDSEYTKAPGTISQSDYDLMIAQVAGESANSPDDMLGVACTILNRLETGGGYGSSVSEVLEIGYFPWGRSYKAYVPGGKYYNTDWGQDKLAMVTQVVNDALNGIRNVEPNVYYYSGDGTNNYFSDIV